MRRRAWAEARRSTRGGGFSSRGSSHDERRGSSTRGGQVDFAAVPWQGQVMLVGLPSLALIVVLTSGVVVRRRRHKSAQAYAHMLDAFREFDPDFDPSSLSRRIERAFLRCQQAWFLRDMRPVRTLMSDAVYERLRTQLALLHAQGVRDALGEIDVKRVAIRSLEGGTRFDRVVAVVDAHIEDSEAPASASDETARKIARGTRKTWVREFWTFLRRRGASTPAHAAPFEGSCPNCGGPVTPAETTNCEHCDVIINSGTYDWTLSAIVQPAFMPEEKPPAPAGLDDARTDDPELSVEMLEDRAGDASESGVRRRMEGGRPRTRSRRGR